MSTTGRTTARPRFQFAPRIAPPTPERSITALFWVWLAFRTLAWTLVAASQPNPPLDTVEWLCWGNQWQLGYHKHPPLPAWVAEAAFFLWGHRFVAVYLTGYLFLALALFSVWRLARRLLPPWPALAATMGLDGLVFLGPLAMEYNNHLPLIAFWSLSICLFHRALEHDRWRDWLGLGVAFGLALLCKYAALFLIAPLLAYWLWHNGARRWSRPAVVALVTTLVVLPHFVWLCRHDFPTLRWVQLRTAGDSGTLDHRFSALVFLAGQLLRLLPVLLILLPILTWRRRPTPAGLPFLTVAVLGPVVLHLAASVVFGAQLRDIWGAPLWTFAGLLLVLLVQTDDSNRAWRRFGIAWAAVTGCLLVGALANNVSGAALRGKPMRVHYPGRQLSKQVAWRYQARFGTPPAIVAGDWWLAANICVHSPHRPALYGSLEPSAFGLDLARVKGDPRRFIDPDPRTAPWTSDPDVARRGGVLVWDAHVFGDRLPSWLEERYPQAQPQPPVVLRFLGGSQKALRVGWAAITPPPG